MKFRQLSSLMRTLVAAISAAMVLCTVPVFADETAEVTIEEVAPVEEAITNEIVEENAGEIVETAAEENVQDTTETPAEESAEAPMEVVEAPVEQEQPIYIGKSSISSAVIRSVTVSTNGGVITANSPFKDGKHTYTYTWTGQMRPIKLPGKKITDDAGCISKVGYVFKGWKDANGKKFSKINGKTPDKVELKAEWQENTYSIQYKFVDPTAVSDNRAALKGKNHGKPIKKIGYSQQVELLGDEFKVAGYELIGWSTRSGSKEAMYAPKEKVSGIGGQTKEVKKISLYPVWSKK